MSDLWEVLFWTLHQESCCVNDGQIVALSDRRVVYFDASEMIGMGYIDRGGQPTEKFHSNIRMLMSGKEIHNLMVIFKRSDRWRFKGNYAVSDHTKSRILRHRIVYLIREGMLQIDADGWISRCTTSPGTLIRPPATV